MLGIGDDAALLRVAAGQRIWWRRWIPSWPDATFRDGSDARSIGHRALAVNLSDMAAMGATPAWATLALDPAERRRRMARAILRGVLAILPTRTAWRWSAATPPRAR